MDDHIFRTLDRLKGLADQVLTRLHEHLDGHVVRNAVFLNQGAQDLIFRFARGREADLNLLHADVDQELKHLQLFLQVHGVYQRLVAVAQVNAAPDGRMVDHLVGPFAVLHLDRGKRDVLFAAFIHREFLLDFPPVYREAIESMEGGNFFRKMTKSPAPYA